MVFTNSLEGLVVFKSWIKKTEAGAELDNNSLSLSKSYISSLRLSYRKSFLI